MNKQEFLQRLREKLNILNDTELEDILSEYEQHIDRKVAEGLSEEAAIAGFGKLDELAAEILEAYHVRADYAEKNKAKHSAEAGKAAQEVWNKSKNKLTEGWKSSSSSLKRAGHYIKEKSRKCTAAFKRFVNQEKEQDVQAAHVQKQPHSTGFFGRIFNFMKRCILACWRECLQFVRVGLRMVIWCAQNIWKLTVWCVKNGWKLVVWAAKLCWNLFWGCAGICVGLFACVCLFALGILAVLLVQGYPLAGITIGALGVTLCAGSLTVGCFTFFIRRKKTGTAPVEMAETGEGEVANA